MAKARGDGKKPGKGLSRRAFLSTGAVFAIATPMARGGRAQTKPIAADATPVLGPGKVPMTLRVNGKAHQLALEPRVTLLEALRDHLDYTGAKKVCDRGTCGACTVILDGRAVYSCSVLAVEAQGRDIVTVEGLATDTSLHPVQAAFVANDGLQCGFCTPGFVVACKSFLDRNPDPTLEQIERGLGGNICRCGTYVGIRQAVLDAAKAMKGGKSHA